MRTADLRDSVAENSGKQSILALTVSAQHEQYLPLSQGEKEPCDFDQVIVF
jgi:hypothetical protein